MEAKQLEELWKDRMAVRSIIVQYETDYDVVDDIMMETYAAALESDYNEQSAPLTWLCTLARNTAVDYVRQQNALKRTREVLSGLIPQRGDSTEEYVPYYDRGDLSTAALEATEAQDPMLIAAAEGTMKDALEAMPPKMAMAVQMRMEGHPNAEIARELGCKDKTLRNLIYESREYFRDNSQFNTTNRVSSRERQGVRTPATQGEVERAQRDRFDTRSSAFNKRMIRHTMPDASLTEWEKNYEQS